MPHSMTVEDLAPLKFDPRTTLLNHWMHRPSMLLCLVISNILLHFLHDQLSSYFSSVPDPTLPQNFFLSFIGPPDHINARYCFHSHIIGCHVSPSQDYHSVLSAVCPDGVWNGRLDWAPLFFYLLATSFFSDSSLSRLYSGPSITLFCFSFRSLHPLRSLSSRCCLCVHLSSSEFDIFSICLTPPPLLIPDAPPPPFALSPLRRLLLLFCATRAQPQQTNYTWRAELLDAHTVAADQHFPFYCTPYYGYSPPTHHDMHTMIFELATFLTSFAFLDDGSPLQELESASLSPGSLLSPLSSIHSDHMNLYPGEGVFFLDNCPDPTKIGRKAFSRSGKRKA